MAFDKTNNTCCKECFVNLTILIVLAIIGVAVWGWRIDGYRGYIYNDSGHLVYSYTRNLAIELWQYFPWSKAHRPLGRDAISMILLAFGENHIRFIGTLLGMHILNAYLCFRLILSITSKRLIAFAAGIFFLVSINAFLPIYWPAAIFDLLSTTFVLLATLSLIYALRSQGTKRAIGFAINGFVFLLAVKTKESSLVLVVPMFFIYVTHLFLKDGTPQGVKAFFLRIKLADLVWGFGLFALCLLLVCNLESDFNPGKSGVVDPAYARDYSPKTILTSFGLYIANYFYVANDPAPISPQYVTTILIALITVTIFLRNYLMMLGLVWWFSFLFFLSVMVVQYKSPHYPYPATIGGAMFLAALFLELEKFSQRFLKTTKVATTLLLGFIAFNIYCTNNWLRYDTLPLWAENFHRLSMKMFDSLKQTIPSPGPNAEFVIVTDKFSFLDQGPNTAIRAVYKELTLKGHLTNSLSEGEKYYSECKSSEKYLIKWGRDRFIVVSHQKEDK